MSDQLTGRDLDMAVAKAIGYHIRKDGTVVGENSMYSIACPKFSTDHACLPEMMAWLIEGARRKSAQGPTINWERSYRPTATGHWIASVGTTNKATVYMDSSHVAVATGTTIPEAVARLVVEVAKP